MGCIRIRHLVSIPQSGFGAFERIAGGCPRYHQPIVSIPQSGFGAFELAKLITLDEERDAVSIPQSGFGAFEPFRIGVPQV